GRHRASNNRHFPRHADLPQQVARPLRDVAPQDLVPILRHPDHVILQIRHRGRATPIFDHPSLRSPDVQAEKLTASKAVGLNPAPRAKRFDVLSRTFIDLVIVAVGRQYCDALGKIANCQVAVSTALLARQLALPTTMELYVPENWTEHADRRARVDTRPPLSAQVADHPAAS